MGPLDPVFAFWKPLVDPAELEALVSFAEWDAPRRKGIQVLPTAGDPQPYRLLESGVGEGGADDDGSASAAGSRGALLFCSVHPIAEPPDNAEVLARITDAHGKPHSYVLWYPHEGCVVVPFDPGEAIRALWFERYMQKSARKTLLPTPVLAAYYRLRPLIPPALRILLRQGVARPSLDAGSQVLSWPSDDSLNRIQRLLMRTFLLASGREEVPFIWFWPSAHPWAAVLTHDVETAAGLGAIPRIMSLERDRGLRSSFNMVVRDYDVPAELLASLAEGGFEVGVHGYTHDGLMFLKWSTFIKRAEKINAQAKKWGAVGFRSPATYRNPDWLCALEVEYDSSFADVAPFEPQPGGCASLFPYLIGDIAEHNTSRRNPSEGSTSAAGVVELPMTLVMDHTLFGLLGHTDADLWLEKLDQIEAAHGMACILTHPDPTEGYIGVPENEAHYVQVLDRLAASDAWVPLPRDLARWWRLRASTFALGAGAIACANTGIRAGRSHANTSSEALGAVPARAGLDADGGLAVSLP